MDIEKIKDVYRMFIDDVERNERITNKTKQKVIDFFSKYNISENSYDDVSLNLYGKYFLFGIGLERKDDVTLEPNEMNFCLCINLETWKLDTSDIIRFLFDEEIFIHNKIMTSIDINEISTEYIGINNLLYDDINKLKDDFLKFLLKNTDIK